MLKQCKYASLQFLFTHLKGNCGFFVHNLMCLLLDVMRTYIKSGAPRPLSNSHTLGLRQRHYADGKGVRTAIYGVFMLQTMASYSMKMTLFFPMCIFRRCKITENIPKLKIFPRKCCNKIQKDLYDRYFSSTFAQK